MSCSCFPFFSKKKGAVTASATEVKALDVKAAAPSVVAAWPLLPTVPNTAATTAVLPPAPPLSRLNQSHLWANMPTVGSLEPIESLGKGGFATVLLTRDQNARMMAIKKFPNIHDLCDEVSLLQFESPYIVAPLAVFFDRCSLAVEYMPKGSLYDLLKKEPSLNWEIRVGMMLDVCRGLQTLHQAGYAHRDIKSLNVVVDDFYRAKLADFNLVGPKDQLIVVGQYSHMAPELFFDAKEFIDHAISDIYSLGVLFFEMMRLPEDVSVHLGVDRLLRMYLQDKINGRHYLAMTTEAKHLCIQHEDQKDSVHVALLYELVLACVDLDPVKRPSLTMVIQRIDQHLKQFDSKSDYLRAPAAVARSLAPPPVESAYWWVENSLIYQMDYLLNLRTLENSNFSHYDDVVALYRIVPFREQGRLFSWLRSWASISSLPSEFTISLPNIKKFANCVAQLLLPNISHPDDQKFLLNLLRQLNGSSAVTVLPEQKVGIDLPQPIDMKQLNDVEVIRTACHWFSKQVFSHSVFFYEEAKARRMVKIREAMQMPAHRGAVLCATLVNEYMVGGVAF